MKGSEERKRNLFFPSSATLVLHACCAFGMVQTLEHDNANRNQTKTCIKSKLGSELPVVDRGKYNCLLCMQRDS